MYPDSDCAPPLVFILSLTNATGTNPVPRFPGSDSASTSDSSIGTGTRSGAASAHFSGTADSVLHSGFHNHFRPSSGVETHYSIFK
ncbi:unnamed protein product [Penicillium camemberti]|uniref:Str. FM013 n=1 Tax=Penicillium camemberti (strain FM 013) TaxID=1429867 RepID=A0A0G4PUX8_PENC3|nr:unnamed protein product [Penicillium camemberti]